MYVSSVFLVFILSVSSVTHGQKNGQVCFFRSQNYPTYMWGYDVKGEAYIKTELGTRLFRLTSPGLTEQSNTISFEAADHPGYFLRHYGYLLHLEHSSNPRNAHIFAQDSTFFVRQNKWFPQYTAYESVNYPGYFIRHAGYRLQINKYDGSDLFKKDASFALVDGSSFCSEAAFFG